MKTTKEKQITSYEQLVRICESFGARYNPSNDAIKPAALSALLEQAQQALQAATVAQQAKTFVISDRIHAYAEMSKLATRIFHAMAASKAPKQLLEDAMQVRRALTARKAKDRPATSSIEKSETVKRKGNPASQLNFEAQARNFSRLIDCAKAHADYAPFEDDLKVDALEAYSQKLQQLTRDVIAKDAQAKDARTKRNALLFGNAGIKATAATVKHYVQGIFPYGSEQVKNIKHIRFASK